MNYPADSTAKLCQGGKGLYVGREGVPVDNCSREECEPVIVFESLWCGDTIHTVEAYSILVRVFSDVLVAFLYFDICHNRQSNLAIENPEFSQPVVARAGRINRNIG